MIIDLDDLNQHPELAAFINAKPHEDLVALASKLKPSYEFSSGNLTPLIIAAALGYLPQVNMLCTLHPDAEVEGAINAARSNDHEEIANRLTQTNTMTLPMSLGSIFDSMTPEQRHLLIGGLESSILSPEQLKRIKKASEWSVFNQDEIISRMSIAGYIPNPKGACYGISHMVMQAFLTDEYDSMVNLMHTIRSIPLDDFRHDNEYQHDITNNTRVIQNIRDQLKDDNMPCDTIDVRKKITNMLAFFDGVALIQDTYAHKALFEEGSISIFQSFDAIMPFVLTMASDTPEKKPALIDDFFGEYDRNTLTQFLTISQSHLTENFSIQLSGKYNKEITSGHAINLNYDSAKQQWLLVDPNRLPGVTFGTGMDSHVELANAIFGCYGTLGVDEQQLDMSIYTTSEHANSFREQYALLEMQDEWLKPRITDALRKACASGPLERVKCLIDRMDGPLDASNLLSNAFKGNQFEIVKFLIDEKKSAIWVP